MGKEYGWLFRPKQTASGREIDFEGQYQDLGDYEVFYFPHPAFQEECVFGLVEDRLYLTDGVVLNRPEGAEKASAASHGLDQQYLTQTVEAARQDPFYFAAYDGTFNGLCVDIKRLNGVFFTNPVGERTVYYVPDAPGGLWVGSNYNWLLRELHRCGFSARLDTEAFRSMVVFGGMCDAKTWVQGVSRLLAGQVLQWKGADVTVQAYHTFDSSHPEEGVSEAEWVERLDATFRRELSRALQMDQKYGYTSLIDVSGGLDSRMVAFVAKDLGVEKAVLLSYAAMGSHEQKIAQEVAEAVRLPFLFSGIDDAQYVREIPSLVRANFGASYYIGITGGKRMLSWLDSTRFGLEHTGLLGDMAEGGFFEELSGQADYRINPNIEPGANYYEAKSCYPNAEMFYLHTRGMLWGLSSMITRRDCVESFSPFMSRDFLELSHSIPTELRWEGHIFIEWMKQKYPDAAAIRNAKGMVAPAASPLQQQWHRKVLYRLPGVMRRIQRLFAPKTLRKDARSMNPLPHWVEQDPSLRTYLQEAMRKGLEQVREMDALQDIFLYFAKEGANFYEQAAFLTAVEAYRLYVEDDTQ